MKLNKKKIALIIGAGDYLGSALAKKFAVGGLSVTGETYRPYKGVRNIARSGRFL